MAETVETSTENVQQQVATAPKIVKRGEERVVTNNNIPTVDDTTLNVDKQASDEAAKLAEKDLGHPNTETTSKPTTTTNTLTEDQLKDFFTSQGLNYEGLEKLKEKLNYTPHIEPSQEEKTKAELAREKRLVDLYVAGGGRVEDYVAIKNVANADVAQLSLEATKKELKDAGFKEDEISKIINNRYYQGDEQELEQLDDESDSDFENRKQAYKDFAKKTKEYFATKLANRSSHTKKTAQDILDRLSKAVESSDLQAKEEAAISSNIDETFKNLPRKQILELGELDGKAIAPVEYKISDSDLSELAQLQSTLMDSAKRNQLLYNEDGSLNLTNLSSVLIQNKLLKSQLKTVYHEGGSRQVSEFSKVFPLTPNEIGVGGSSQRRPEGNGKIVRRGDTRVVTPQNN